MRWLTNLRIYLGHDEPIDGTPNVEVAQEAIDAKKRAEQAVFDARKRKAELEKVTKELEKLRIRNHFGESIQIAMMRK